MKWRVLAALVLGQALTWPAVAAEQLKPCPFPVIAAAQPPGPRMLQGYSHIRSQVPKSSGCDIVPNTPDRQDNGCEFVDRYGYVDSLASWELGRDGRLEDRYIYHRSGKRARKPVLPYGVVWSDTPAIVARKLKAHGAKPDTGVSEGRLYVTATSCQSKEPEDYFWVTFDFGVQGPLQEVTLNVLYRD
jgi:hypothetical protein